MSYKDFYNYLKEFESYSLSKSQRHLEIMKKAINSNNSSEVRQTGLNMRELRHELLESFIFKISKPLMTMLYLTDNDDIEYNPIEHKLPYDKVFLDSEIIFDNYKIKGLLISKSLNKSTNKESIFVNFLIIAENANINGRSQMDSYIPCIDIFQKDSFKENDFKDYYVNVNFDDELRNNLRCLVLNFLNFLNNPTIEIIKSENTKSYGGLSGKIKKGSQEIILTGKLKKYLDSIEDKVKDVKFMKKSHWVRGHWRRFVSEVYVNKKGSKTWIYPYICGFGIIEKKDYFVKNNENEPKSEQTTNEVTQETNGGVSHNTYNTKQ